MKWLDDPLLSLRLPGRGNQVTTAGGSDTKRRSYTDAPSHRSDGRQQAAPPADRPTGVLIGFRHKPTIMIIF